MLRPAPPPRACNNPAHWDEPIPCPLCSTPPSAMEEAAQARGGMDARRAAGHHPRCEAWGGGTPCNCKATELEAIIRAFPGEGMMSEPEDTRRPEPTRCVGCGYPIAPGERLCGECACEEDGA